MVNPTEMVGEIEIAATTHCIQRPVHVCVGNSVLEFGTEFVDSNAIVVNYLTPGEDVGHYEAVFPSTDQQTDESDPCRKMVTPAMLSPISKAAISKARTRTSKSEIITSSPYKDDLMTQSKNAQQ